MMVAWHAIVGLGEVSRIVVEMIPPFKIIGLLARGGFTCLVTISSHVGAIWVT